MTTAPARNKADWLSTNEAAVRLGITNRTLYRFINAGELRAHRMGRVIRIPAGAIDEFLAGTVIKPGDLNHLTYEDDDEAAVV